MINVVTSSDVIDALFGGIGTYKAKTIVFGIVLLVIATIFLFWQIRKSSKYRYIKIIALLLCIIFTVGLAGYNFLRASPPPTNFTPKEMWLGNESENITSKNYDRLEYLQKNFVIVKRTWIDTPSRFDYSDDGSQDYLDDAADFYKTHEVQPQWDVHVYTYGECTIFRIVLFYANQRNTKHDLDFEYVEFYYRNSDENNTDYEVPDYISFPTYAKIVEHPRVFLTWHETPTLHNNIKALTLDPDTNSFAEKYWLFPKYKDNYRLTWITPESDEYLEYLTQTEQIQVSFGFISGTFLFVYLIAYRTKRFYTLLYLMIICFAIGFYPLLTLQFDFVVKPTFRIWVNSHPEDDAFYQSASGREYISRYNTSWLRSSWNTPDNTVVCT